jgi:hypothetical protein
MHTPSTKFVTPRLIDDFFLHFLYEPIKIINQRVAINKEDVTDIHNPNEPKTTASK